jgi:transitional endoplasmic reticulum ATPase
MIKHEVIMEASALAALLEAYKISKSADIGKLILSQYLQAGEFAKASEFLLELSLKPEQLVETIVAFAQASQLDQLQKLLVTQDVTATLQALIDQNQETLAKDLYLYWCQHQPNIKNIFWDNRLRINAETEEQDSRPRLRVVEKNDLAEVTHLSDYKQATVTFKDVVGLEAVKEQITKRIILPFQKPSFFQKFKKKIGGGVLLYGPPGCGKTLIARATAGQCNASFYNIQAADVLDMYIGESEQKLRAIFEKARADKPCILFFDELEALAGKREHARNSSTANVVSQFLTELDGYSQGNDGILILASTNVPWSVDPAFLRPGRFDRLFFVPPPDKVARAAILQHQMKDRPQENNIDFDLIANKTSGYSGADLANLVEMAADEAIDSSIAQGREVAISFDHFREALTQSRNSTSEWLTTARNYARYANDGGRYDDVLEFLNKYGKS